MDKDRTGFVGSSVLSLRGRTGSNLWFWGWKVGICSSSHTWARHGGGRLRTDKGRIGQRYLIFRRLIGWPCMWTARLAAKWRSDKILYSIQALLREERWYYFTIVIAQFIHVFPRIFLLGFNATWGGCPHYSALRCLSCLPPCAFVSLVSLCPVFAGLFVGWNCPSVFVTHGMTVRCILFRFCDGVICSNSPMQFLCLFPVQLTVVHMARCSYLPAEDGSTEWYVQRNRQEIRCSSDFSFLGPRQKCSPRKQCCRYPSNSRLSGYQSAWLAACQRLKFLCKNRPEDDHIQWCTHERMDIEYLSWLYLYIRMYITMCIVHVYIFLKIEMLIHCVNMCIRESIRQYVGVSICWYTYITYIYI